MAKSKSTKSRALKAKVAESLEQMNKSEVEHLSRRALRYCYGALAVLEASTGKPRESLGLDWVAPRDGAEQQMVTRSISEAAG